MAVSLLLGNICIYFAIHKSNVFINFPASTSRRHLIVWKYNPSGCVTALKCKQGIESLCYSEYHLKDTDNISLIQN